MKNKNRYVIWGSPLTYPRMEVLTIFPSPLFQDKCFSDVFKIFDNPVINKITKEPLLPLAVSPLNITQSAPSSTAFATSEASARVGRGFEIMLSNIWVATMHGFPAKLHLLVRIFWAMKTCEKYNGLTTGFGPHVLYGYCAIKKAVYSIIFRGFRH